MVWTRLKCEVTDKLQCFTWSGNCLGIPVNILTFRVIFFFFFKRKVPKQVIFYKTACKRSTKCKVMKSWRSQIMCPPKCQRQCYLKEGHIEIWEPPKRWLCFLEAVEMHDSPVWGGLDDNFESPPRSGLFLSPQSSNALSLLLRKCGKSGGTVGFPYHVPRYVRHEERV